MRNWQLGLETQSCVGLLLNGLNWNLSEHYRWMNGWTVHREFASIANSVSGRSCTQSRPLNYIKHNCTDVLVYYRWIWFILNIRMNICTSLSSYQFFNADWRFIILFFLNLFYPIYFAAPVNQHYTFPLIFISFICVFTSRSFWSSWFPVETSNRKAFILFVRQ